MRYAPIAVPSPANRSTERTTAERESGFLQRFDAVADSLYAWVCARLPPAVRRHVDPEELFQEIACRAWQSHVHGGEDVRHFRGWLFGIGRNVLREELRRVARRPERAGVLSFSRSSVARRVAAEVTSIGRRAARREQVQRLLATLDGFEAADRRLVVYRALEGWSFPRIGAVLGIGEEAAKKRWQRLRGRLRMP